MNDERLTEIYRRHSRDLLGFLSGFTAGNRSSAEDLLQETMIRAWRHIDVLPAGAERTRRWLFTVARNVAIDSIRRKQVRPSEVGLSDRYEPGPDETSATVLAVESLRRAIGDLSLPHRRVLAELYVRGRSPGEVARQLGVPVGTVKSRAHYALRSLRTAVDSR
ncbi:sigma-70 family RNA polymerase sigma factor [Actinoplanes sp. L3-i22]|uniref:sigma-70 family RNA polymerase sigma factor n=1 Tax=Actinoplanes sp. L3-i22 TaxID=2836373 RepID=UPI00210855E6|nr:sigma-70 family RNA polymerase sigma factor [Actinoplanes sp. L3-i22]